MPAIVRGSATEPLPNRYRSPSGRATNRPSDAQARYRIEANGALASSANSVLLVAQGSTHERGSLGSWFSSRAGVTPDW